MTPKTLTSGFCLNITDCSHLFICSVVGGLCSCVPVFLCSDTCTWDKNYTVDKKV